MRNTDTNLCAECQLIAQCGHVILQQVHQPLEEWVVLTFHVSVPDNTTEVNTNESHNQEQRLFVWHKTFNTAIKMSWFVGITVLIYY